MKNHNSFQLAFVTAALLGLSLAQAANVSKPDYQAGKTRISADYKTDKSACKSLAGNAKDVCEEEAEAKKKVAKAELEYGYTGKASDRQKVQEVKAKTAYAVAKEKCDDKAGNEKAVCVKEAKATETKALADAKMNKEVGEAKQDASADKRDADYQVAAQKCDALAGDAKSNCISAAKAKFGKS